MPGTFSLPSTSKETAIQRSRHASRHVRGNRSRHSRRMRNPQFYVYGKKPMMLQGGFTSTRLITWIPRCMKDSDRTTRYQNTATNHNKLPTMCIWLIMDSSHSNCTRIINYTLRTLEKTDWLTKNQVGYLLLDFTEDIALDPVFFKCYHCDIKLSSLR